MPIFALIPVVATSFPLLTPIVFAVAGAMGYKALTSGSEEHGELNKKLKLQIEQMVNVTLQVEQVVVETLELEVGQEEYLFFEKDEIRVAIIKNERGKLRVTATAPKGTDKEKLKAEANAFVEELAQAFALNHAVKTLEKINAEVVQEEVTEEQEIRLTLRRWS